MKFVVGFALFATFIGAWISAVARDTQFKNYSSSKASPQVTWYSYTTDPAVPAECKPQLYPGWWTRSTALYECTDAEMKAHPVECTTTFGWRPTGLAAPQGCCTNCECDHCECQGTGLGPYFLFVEWTKCSPWLGGLLIFDYRGYNGDYYLPILLGLICGFVLFSLASYVAKCTGTPGTWVNRRMGAPYSGSSGCLQHLLAWRGWTRGEMFMMVWLLGILSMCGVYYHEHARINNSIAPYSRAFAGVALGISSVILLPASRHSVLLPFFGISFERSLKFHRVLGYLLFWMTTAHVISMFNAFVESYQQGRPANDGMYDEATSTWTKLPTRTFLNGQGLGEACYSAATHLSSWGIQSPLGPPMAGLIAWCVMFAMIVTTNFRRGYWEVFLVMHMGYAVVFVMIWIHHPTSMVLHFPAMLVYFIDLCLRRSVSKATILEARYFPEAGITRVKVKPHSESCTPKIQTTFGVPGPGQWISIAVTDLGPTPGHDNTLLQLHPFSVSSHLDDGAFTLHVKDFGNRQWTRRLAEAAEEGSLNGALCRIDGPFGDPQPPLGSTKVAYLIAGGVGITPLLHMTQCALKNPALLPQDGELTLIWSFRLYSELEPYMAILSSLYDMMQDDKRIRIRLFETTADTEEPPSVADDHPLLRESVDELDMLSWIVKRGTADEQDGMELQPTLTSNPILEPDEEASVTRVGTRFREAALPISPDESEPSASHGVQEPEGSSYSDAVVYGSGNGHVPWYRKSLIVPRRTLETEPGRPNVEQIIHDAATNRPGVTPDDIAVYTNGPSALVKRVETACHSLGVVCHTDTFEL